MNTIDVYSRYYKAEADFSGVRRNAAVVKLTVESGGGNV